MMSALGFGKVLPKLLIKLLLVNRVAGTCMLSGWGLEKICNYGGCPHGEGGDRGTNMKWGCIQLGLSWE